MGQKASGDTVSGGFAPRGQPLQSCTVQDAGALDLNDAIPAELISLPAPPPLGSPLANPHHPLQPRAQPPQHAAFNIISKQPAFASTRSQRSCRRCTQRAYFGGSAASAASSIRDSVPATLPHHPRSHCLHASPPLGSPLANPPPPATAPRASIPARNTRPSSMDSRRWQAPAPSPAARRCTQRTTEVQRRQLRHPSETRCQRRCPS
jgi:hypothetical protein